MKQTIYIPVKAEEELPPKRKEITDYSIRVIGVFSDSLVDYVHYNYHTKKWSFSDGDNYGTLEMKHWLKPVEMPSEEEILQILKDELYVPRYGNRFINGKGQVAKAIIKLMKGEK